MEEGHGRPPTLAGRGLGFQAVGFAIVGVVGTLIYNTFAGSDHWAYQLFADGFTKFYWAFVVPLGAFFDWVRKMFETTQEIRRVARERAIAKARAKGRADGLAEGRADGLAEGRAEGVAEVMRRVQNRMESEGLPPDTIDRILNGHRNGSEG